MIIFPVPNEIERLIFEQCSLFDLIALGQASRKSRIVTSRHLRNRFSTLYERFFSSPTDIDIFWGFRIEYTLFLRYTN